MYPVSPQAYDRAITVFSPDGRLFQVEYAKEAVKMGATAFGMVCKEGVILVSFKNIQSTLLVPESMKKIFSIDDHIAATASGIVGDSRRLIDFARVEAQKHRVSYNEPSKVETIAREIGDIMQLYTQYGGGRPFGVSLLIAGIEEEPYLFETEPSGSVIGLNAGVIGRSKKEGEEFLEKNYKKGISIEEGIKLCIKALKKTGESPITKETVEIAVCTIKEGKFKELEPKEVASYL